MTALALPPESNRAPADRLLAIERLFSRISDLSSLPSVAQRVMMLANDEKSTFDDLREAIMADPALVARILRRVNSSYYGLRNRVADFPTAIKLLGLREVQNLAMTIFVAKMFEGNGNHGNYSRQGLWMHSLAVALVSRLVASVCGVAKPEEAYVAGLLHDIGYVLLDQKLRRHFWILLDSLKPGAAHHLADRRVFTFDHAELGSFIAQRWNFPKRIVDAIGSHHEPEIYAGSNRELVYVVSVANYVCNKFEWTSLGVANDQVPADRIFKALELDAAAMSIIDDELPGILEKANGLASA